MDLILWRHAEAEIGRDEQSSDKATAIDLHRALTVRGEKQAARMAGWLDRQLPVGTRILVSPARRCEQTALALGRKYKICPELAPLSAPAHLLKLAQWPDHRQPILIIGHQPVLGQTIAQLIGIKEGECSVKKGAVWWLRRRDRGEQNQTLVVTVQSPELL